jgi:hypothetical protein
LRGKENKAKSVPSVAVSYARNGSSTRANALGMRPMQERAYEKRGEQYLLIKSPPASGKSRALMCIALDTLADRPVLVLEFKVGANTFLPADRAQVEDYALDLFDFHAGSRQHVLVPILVATDATSQRTRLPLLWHGVAPVEPAPAPQADAALL